MSEVGERIAVDLLRREPAHAPALPSPGRMLAPPAKARGFGAAVEHALETRRLFLLLPFMLIAGEMVSLVLPATPEPMALAAVGAAIVAAIPVGLRSLAGGRLLALFAAFWLGFSLLAIHGALFGTTMLERPAYGIYEARVDEVLSAPEGGARVVVSNISPTGNSRALPMRKARLVVRGHTDLAPGDSIRGPIRFYPVPGPVVPNGFDTQFHSYFDGIGAYGNTTGDVEVVVPAEQLAPARLIDSIRRGIAARLDAELPQPAAGITRSLITGDESEVTDEARDDMATAGIAHVLSVSGLHLTIVAGGVYALLRLLLATFEGLARRVSIKRVAALGGIIAAVLYFLISGWNVAALRSTLMILLVLGAVVFGRQALTMRNVAIAALLVIVLDPAGVFRPSFQLSFAAVVALVGVWELAVRRERGERAQRGLIGHGLAYVGGIIATSFVAGSATLLFTVYHFQQTSPLGIVGNLLTLPLVGFVMMPAAAIATLLMPLGLEQPFVLALGWSIDRMLDVATLVTAWSSGLNATPLLQPVALVFGLAAFAWFVFFDGWQRLLAVPALIAAVLLFGLDQPPDVLVSDTTRAVALRGATDLELVDGKDQSFAVSVWRDTYGEPIAAGSTMLKCDSLGCFGTSPRGFTIAIVDDPAAFYEDCPEADLVLTHLVAPKACAAPTIIDADALARFGIHWLRWDANSRRFDIRTAMSRTSRPWHVLAVN